MAGCALQAAELVRNFRILGFLHCGSLVAFVASYRNVAADKRESRLLVSSKRERRGMIAMLCVAAVALVHVWRTGKLCLVRILMTIGTVRKLHFEIRILASGGVTLGTRDIRMHASQWECSQVVLREGEFRWLKARKSVAVFALSPIRSCGELSPMRIGTVAVRTLGMRDGTPEVAALVTCQTRDIPVLAFQWKLRQEVIEVSSQRNRAPTCRCMAGFATLTECCMVRVGMAVGAFRKYQPGELKRRAFARCRRMTLLAGDFDMRSRQGKFRQRVVEVLPGFPVVRAVTFLAGVAEFPLVRILMTTCAISRKPQKSPVQIFDGNARALRGEDMLCGVALCAHLCRMFAGQRKTGLPMVKPFQVRLPADQGEILSVVV